MSKRHKSKRKKNIPWGALVLGGLLLLVAAYLFATRNQGDGGGTPSIVVDQETIDYGDVKFNTNKTFAIKITNTGDGNLRFKEKPYVEVLEGC